MVDIWHESDSNLILLITLFYTGAMGGLVKERLWIIVSF